MSAGSRFDVTGWREFRPSFTATSSPVGPTDSAIADALGVNPRTDAARAPEWRKPCPVSQLRLLTTILVRNPGQGWLHRNVLPLSKPSRNRSPLAAKKSRSR